MRVETDCGNLTRRGHIKNDLRLSKPRWYKWNPKNVCIFDHLFTFWESFYGGEFTQTEYYDSCCSHYWVQLLMPFVLYESNQIIQSELCCLWKYPLLCWHCKVAHAEDNSHLLCVWDRHRQVKSDKHAICSGLSWSMRVLDTSVFTSYSMDTVHSRCVMLHTLLFSQTGKGYLRNALIPFPIHQSSSKQHLTRHQRGIAPVEDFTVTDTKQRKPVTVW